MIRDSFVIGPSSQTIRQRLLENKTLNPATASDQARTLDLAQNNSEAYDAEKFLAVTAPSANHSSTAASTEKQELIATASRSNTTYFCGGRHHLQRYVLLRKLFASSVTRDIFSKVWQSKSLDETIASARTSSLCAIQVAPPCLAPATQKVSVGGSDLSALVDTGSSCNIATLTRNCAWVKVADQTFVIRRVHDVNRCEKQGGGRMHWRNDNKSKGIPTRLSESSQIFVCRRRAGARLLTSTLASRAVFEYGWCERPISLSQAIHKCVRLLLLQASHLYLDAYSLIAKANYS